MDIFVLGLSTLLQLVAGLLALRLIRVTGRAWAWVLLGAAIFFMAARRVGTLFQYLATGGIDRINLPQELVGLCVSLLIVAAIASMRPILRRLRQDAAQSEAAEGRLRDIVDNAPVGIFRITPERRFISANAALARIFGYRSPEEFMSAVGADIDVLFHEPDALERLARQMGGQEHVEGLEIRVRRRAGDSAWVSVNARSVCDEHGELAFYDGFVTDVTARKQAELDRFREQRLFHEGPVVVFRWYARAGWPVEYVSPNIIQFGFAPEAFMSGAMPYTEFIAPEDRGRVEEIVFANIASGNDYFEMDYRVRRADGLLSWVLDRTVAVRDEGGDVASYDKYIQDITQRKETERALAQSEQRYRAVVEDQTELVCRFRLDGIVNFVNEAYCRYFGRTREELEGSSYFPYLPEDEVAPAIEYLSTLGPDNPVSTRRHRVIAASGEVRWQEWTSRAMFDDQGNVVEFQGVGRDVTDIKRAEEALRRSELKYRTVAQFTSDWEFWLGPDWRFEYLSPSCRHISGYSAQDFLEKPELFLDIIHPGDRENVRDTVTFSLRESSPGAVDFRITRRDHKTRWLSLVYQPVSGPDNELLGLRGSLRDITDRKHLEAELLEAKAQAEAASQAKSEFLANMSHEVRTPISSILGIVEMAMDTETDPARRENLEMMRYSARSLLGIVNDILDFSKIEARKLAIEPEDFDLRAMLEQTVRIFRAQARTQGLDLTLSVDPATPARVRGDPNRYGQVLRNLLSNALKFTQSGSVDVAVSPGGQGFPLTLLCHVTDTGVGIAKQDQPGLFQVFNQVDSSFSKRYRGTGLGLAISRRLVEMMGGTIGVRSEPGRGSVFTFSVRFDAPSGEEAAHELPEAVIPVRTDGAKRILLAEDNELNQRFLKHFLIKHGFEPVVVSNGREVLETLAKEHVDAVLMDVQMPEMDGLEATLRIREGMDGVLDPDVPIVALTAYAMATDRERFLDAGMDDFVAKPVDEKAMVAALQRVTYGTAPDGEPVAGAAGEVPADMGQGDPPLDLDTLLSRYRPAFVREMLDLFVELAEPRMGELRRAVSDGDLKVVEDVAHALAGTGGTIRAFEVIDTARRLQRAALDGEQDHCPLLLEELEGRMDRLLATIRGAADRVGGE